VAQVTASRPTPRALGWIGLAVLAAAAIAVSVVRLQRDAVRAQARAAVRAALPGLREDGFVGSSACRVCHPGAFDSWHGTYHRTMTQAANETSVLGRFDGEPLADGIVPERDATGVWFREGGVRRRVVMTTGSHHMQVYWHAEEDGSLRSAAWAWLREPAPGRFVPNDATLLRPPAETVAYTWNRVCIKCHAVAGNPGWDETQQRVASEVAELGIACEACHGPAAAHVAQHRDPWARYVAHANDEADPTIVQPGRLSAPAASEVCGQCHSITVFADDEAWVVHGRSYPADTPAVHPALESYSHLVRHPLRAVLPAEEASDDDWIDPLLDADPEFFTDRFWADGMVRVSGREYNGLVESPCFASGDLSCTTCHSMHDAPATDQLRVAARSDAVCASCHEEVAAAGEAHGHHDPARVGCMDCHMPHTTYGLLGAIRSHQVDVPRAIVAVETGRPLACDLCHLDRPTAYSAEALARWYGHEIPAGLPAQTPASVVGTLAGDAGQRALWAWHLGWEGATGRGDWVAALLAELLDDPYSAVRIVAQRALRRAGLPEPTVDPLRDGVTARRQVLDRSGAALASGVIEMWLGRRNDRPVRLAE
jgi:predicted CXXCH cytochrome family protein